MYGGFCQAAKQKVAVRRGDRINEVTVRRGFTVAQWLDRLNKNSEGRECDSDPELSSVRDLLLQN